MSRKGKYDHVIAKLPRVLGEEPAYQEKVEAVKNAMTTDPDFKLHASVLARDYILLRAEKEAAEKTLSEINLRLAATQQLMFDAYEAEGVSTLTVDGRPVSCRLEPWAKIEDPVAYRAWCMRDPDLVRRMQLPWQTTNALTKERLLAGEPEPPGVTIHARQRFTLGSE